MRVSIVINTYNRADSLRETIASLQWLDYPDFEVVVVNGPSSDHSIDVLRAFGHSLKVAQCPVRNLSRSRNIGIALSAGDIVAFIDDDAIPDPAWLDGIVPLFSDAEVGAAGGPVFDHTGTRLQAHYLVCDRFGAADLRFEADPSALLNVPGGALFCGTLGTNSLFRRTALLEIGGFDEEYDYFLDETDVCMRMVDAGWKVRYAQAGHVYHRYLPSHIRNEARIVSDYGPVVKNKAYFAARHGAEPHGQAAVQDALNGFVAGVRNTLMWGVEAGHLRHEALDRFEETYDERIRHGFARAVGPRVSSLDPRRRGPELAWRAHIGLANGRPRRLHVCYISQDYPPGVVAGIARVTHELAMGLASAGHVVRVITRGPAHTADFDRGVWVHRVPDAEGVPPAQYADLPSRIWGRSLAVLRELVRIASLRPIDIVQAPNWDCEGLATLLDGRWRFVLGVYTPMTAALAYNPLWRDDERMVREVISPIIAAERACYQKATSLLACGTAIIEQVSKDYALSLAGRRIGLVPHGLPDLGGSPPSPASKATVDILCVGRLEGRKGTDVLLRAASQLLPEMPEVQLFLAGDDTLPVSGGTTMRDAFLRDPATTGFRDRVTFLGVVDDATLDELYRQSDIVAVPSRYESFGLPLIEAMMRGRPVVACNVGGMAEIVALADGDDESHATGLLVPVDDCKALAAALRALAVSATRRRLMGLNARKAFVERYSRETMIKGVVEFYRELLSA